MKWISILVLLLSVAVLGCTPSQQPAPEQENAEEVTFDEAMDSPKQTAGEWLENYDQALKTAKELKRPVLINFTGSDWCSWCIKLHKEVFDKEAFKTYAKGNLVLLKLDFPRSLPQTPEVKAANEKKAKEYGVTGFPTIVLISSDGKEINRTGYQPGGAEAYVKHLQDLLSVK